MLGTERGVYTEQTNEVCCGKLFHFTCSFLQVFSLFNMLKNTYLTMYPLSYLAFVCLVRCVNINQY